MSNTWFCADTHLGHCNIIKYCNRPFKDWEEMSEIIIQNFVEVLRPGDQLWHLGDVCHSQFPIAKFLDRLPPIQVHLVWGNHDKEKLLRHPKIVKTGDLLTFHPPNWKGVGVECCHYPMRSWKSKGQGGYHLFGHCHGRLPPHDRSMDVGVDTHNFYPYHWDEIHSRLKDVPIFGSEDPEKF